MNKISIGITMGDPGGVGPEVLVRAVNRFIKKNYPVKLIIIGDRWILERYAKKFKIDDFFEKENLEFIDLKNVKKRSFKPGVAKLEYGVASLDYIDTAVSLLKKKRIVSLVTSPVSKEVISKAKKFFPGHTEYLGRSFGMRNVLMMLVNRYMRVLPLTRHIPLKDVPRFINYSLIYDGIKLANLYLKKYFSITSPRIAICSLNPHSGEGGVLGNEEKKIIIPAINDLKKNEEIKVFGPYSADGIFSQYKNYKYDCIIGIYHDQVMIPIKMIDPEHTVNITLGLPFIRTSPSHGTAFEIAGKGIASFISMWEAIKLAYQFSHHAHSF